MRTRLTRSVWAATLALSVVAALALAACGGSGTTTTAASPSSAATEAASPSASASPTQAGLVTGAVSATRTRMVVSGSPIPLPTPAVAGTIAFTRYGEDEWTQLDTDVCVVDNDGTGLKVLAGGEGCQSYPRWSPDGSKIAYVQSGIGFQDPQHVWVMNADGSGKARLTTGGSTPDRNIYPSWSPDGRRIAFTHLVYYTGGVERDAIYVMNADGSRVQNVTGKKAPGVTSADYWPTWEKDGTITFYRNTRSGGLSKFSVNPDGSGLTRLVKEAGTSSYEDEDWWVKYELALSPDGRAAARHDTEADRLVVVPVRGGGDPVTLLDPVAAFVEISPDVAWSPNARWLAIAGQSETKFTRIYIVNADGTGLSAIPGVDAAMEPSWRPE